MSFLGKLIPPSFRQVDQESVLVTAASSPPSAQAEPTNADNKIINDFVELADAPEINVQQRLSSYRSTNIVIHKLPPHLKERIKAINQCIIIICGHRHRRWPGHSRVEVPALCSDPKSFYRVIDEPAPILPDVDEVFGELFESKDTVKHPSGLSDLTFAFAGLIALCKSYPSYEDANINLTSGRLDLTPLYGLTPEDAKETVRVMEPSEIGWGLLQTDAFFEPGERLEFSSKATGVLLILFSRNHNSIARRLLKENQQKRWVNPTTLEEESAERQTQDDEIYELAKRVNCAYFRKIVSNDFLKGLLGLSPLDDAPALDLFADAEDVGDYKNSVEFSLLYGWLATMSDKENESVKEALSQLGDPDSVTTEELDSFYSGYADVADLDRGTRPAVGLMRGDDNKFNDSDIAAILQNATASSAHAFRPKGTAEIMALFEIHNIERARHWDVCTFNKFRENIGLTPYTSFEEWCGIPEVAQAAEKLYRKIENLELYPGLRGEKVLDGDGFRLGETMTYALIADIVQVIRTDPAFEADQKLAEVTKLGADELTVKTENGSFGSSLPNVILNNLPNDFNYNSSYGLFPFVTPEKAEELLKKRAEAAAAAGKQETPGPNDIDFGKPKPTNTHTITDPDAAKEILKDNENFKNPLADDLTKLTDGLGDLLGFDKDSHVRDGLRTISGLLSDKYAWKRYSGFIRTALERYIKLYRSKAGKRYEVNYQNVINSAAAAWAAEILCGITLNEKKKDRLSALGLYEKLKDINDTILGTVAPQDKFSTLKRAKDAAKLIRQLIEHSLELANADPCDEGFIEHIIAVLRDLILDEPHVRANTAYEFLARVSKLNPNREELSANVLGLAVITSISFAQSLGTAVTFYLAEAQSSELDQVKELSKPPIKSERFTAEQISKKNADLMGFVREAERLTSTAPVTREALADTVINLPSGEKLEIKKGDRIVLDHFATLAEDSTVDITRPSKKSFLPFIEETVPEGLKTIFGLLDVRSEKGNSLISYTIPTEPPKPPRRLTIGRKGVPIIQRIFDVIYVIVALYLLFLTWSAVGNAISGVNTRTCSNPTHVRPWEAYTMLPGPDNRTAPFIITLDTPTKRRLTFVDIDQRDMRFKVSVNGKKKALSSDFVLDRGINCGEDVEKCLAQGFSRASVIIPKGRRVVKVEWVGKDFVPGTNLVDWGLHNDRRFMWKQEAC